MSCSFSVSFPRSICFSISSQVWNGGFSDPFGYFRPLFGNGPTNPAAVAGPDPAQGGKFLADRDRADRRAPVVVAVRRLIDVVLQAVAGQGRTSRSSPRIRFRCFV